MITEQNRRRMTDNWNQVVAEVRQATEDAGREVGEVKIIGVTKYVDAETTAALVDAGCRDLGENRPQVLWDKAESDWINGPVHWHVIGHLQRNKVRRTIRCMPTVHSVDSARLLKSIATESVAANVTTPVMLEVNISDEDAKTGMTGLQIASLLANLPDSGVKVIGLMAMAGWGTKPDEARSQFAAVRQLRDALSKQHSHLLPELSMGMSGDFAAAIAEGATMVRIGSRLFEGVTDSH